MSARGILLVTAVLGAAAGPYFLSSPENRKKLANWLPSAGSDSTENEGFISSLLPHLQQTSSSALLPRLDPSRGGPADVAAGTTAGHDQENPIVPMEQLLRFDITPPAIINTWPRVTTRLFDGNLEGVRVPVITGTAFDDLVGSLTYYFDQQLQMQRIVLHGQTGDARRLVALVTHNYQLQQEPAVGGWLFTARWNGQPTSIMHVQNAPVVHERNRRHRVQVHLELNRPGAPSGVSAELEKLIREKQQQPEKQNRRLGKGTKK